MGRREQQQDSMLVPVVRAHLDGLKFDEKVERLCEGFFEKKERRGQASIAPGMYFRMLLVGYFEGQTRSR